MSLIEQINPKDVFSEKLKYSSEYDIEFDNRMIYISGDLEDDIGTSLRVKYNLIKQWWLMIEEKKITDITIDISSMGGSIYSVSAALDFYHELEKYEGIKVNTRAQGICMSAATILLSGGSGERMAFPRCKFMLHDVQIEGVGGTANQVQSTVRTISDEQQELFQLYALFSKKGKEDINEKELLKETKRWHKKFTKNGIDHYLSSQDMLKLNLIDTIL